MMHFYRNRADRSSIYVERIQNVAGSTAGAGSADYYAYRNRRRDALAKANWDEKEAMIEGEQKEFEDRNFEEADKKKSKREKRKANKEMAKQAKQFNKFESDGAFLEKYLGKRQENNSEEPIEPSEAIDQSNIQSNDINHDVAGHQAEDSDKSSIDEQPSTTLKFKALAKRISVVQASDVENTAEDIQPHKVIVDKQADSS